MNNPDANLDADRLGIFGTDQFGNKTITYTRLLNHPIEKVWRAITDETHRAAWNIADRANITCLNSRCKELVACLNF
ncbi:MAG: hypothetical protein ACJAX5_001154 [Patiriisocius sp.]|jgi:hypothetical protein